MNLLDQIVISPRTVARWSATASEVSARLSILPSEIGDEDAEILPDGGLLIFCDTVGGVRLAEMVAPADEWFWLPGVKQ